MYLLALSAGGWLLFLQQLFLRYVRIAWFSSQAGAMINALTIYAGITFIFYRVFIQHEKDQKIYNKYFNAWNENPNKRRDLLLTSFVAAVPYVLMICVKILLPR